MNDITISICIPTFNQAKYIEAAIRSAFKQTLMPYEIIVSNDCSTDETSDILNKLLKEIPILKVHNQAINLGIAENVDACLRLAEGKFIIRLDSDDQLAPLYTEKLINIFNEFPDAGYAHCAVQEIDQTGKFLNKRRLIRKTGYRSEKEALKEALKGYKVAANIIMFKKDALIAVEYLTGRPNFGEDYHLTAAISAKGFGNVYVDEILAYYRVWIDTGKVRQKRKLAEINGIRHVFDDVLETAYEKFKLNLSALKKSKENFACQQADCLSWDIYTDNEKREIMTEIFKLSNTLPVRIQVWMYMNKMTRFIKFYNLSKAFPKQVMKNIIKNIPA